MRAFIIIILFNLLAVASATGQTKIDQMLDKMSMLGEVTYSSIVKRNKNTKKIEKVVRQARIKGVRAYSFIKEFDRLAEQHSVMETVKDGVTRLVVIDEADCSRIYTIVYLDKKKEIDVTIIINYKKK
ncbi:MAG: DUF5024 domain-containing protein [Prevotella sp.]|nr:DUF5024 domain-containing protein [Prevotella sp.]MBR6592461.1 DUF5024 domain-containing protein [Prevotella sp.]